MNRLARMYWIAQAVGWENVPRRAWHIVKGRLGLDRHRLVVGELAASELRGHFVAGYDPSQAPEAWRRRAEQFLVGPHRLAELREALPKIAADDLWQAHVGEDVRRLPQGELRFFNRNFAHVGWPVDFNRDAVHQVAWPTGAHWRTYRQFDPRYKDLKCVWEPSRFQVAYALARDYARQANPAAPEMFWSLLATWDAQNPYGLTPQWVCGQEATFRLMAWLFATCLFVDDPATTAARCQRLTELAHYTGRHIEENIGYARSQKNNHALSEAIGLWTLGRLFPELRSAERWRRRGRRIFAAELQRQIYDDGSYLQNSTNYHRVMLDDALWAWRLAELDGQPLDESRPRLEKALAWLLAMIDPASGAVPNYGPNDGALVLPLSCCDYTDFRPVAQAMHFALYGRRYFATGPWDEKMLWLFGSRALAAERVEQHRESHFSAPVGGYYTCSGKRSWGFTRIHAYRDRPSQADMLHFDLWYNGVNVLRDGGSYHYYSEPPWQHFFESTAGHNTVEVDECDQMIRGPSFLWLRWTQARLLAREVAADSQTSFLVGEHHGYRRLPGSVTHRRGILRLRDTYVVVDDLLGSGEHRLALRWRLHAVAWTEHEGEWRADAGGVPLALRVLAPASFNTALRCGQAGPPAEGWESLYYAEKAPVPTLVACGRARLPARIITTIGPVGEEVHVTDLGRAGELAAPLRLAGVHPDLAAAVARTTAGAVVGE